MKQKTTFFIVILVFLIISFILNLKLIVDKEDLKKKVEIQHNNYTECVASSIEDKWELEQFSSEIPEQDIGNYNE